MKVKIRGIPPEGLVIEKTSAPAEYHLADKDLGDFAPLQMEMRVERVSNTVLADLSIKTTLTMPCARCLEMAHYPVDNRFQFNYSITEATDYIDLTEDIRQDIILELPIKILCKEDCKGLCPHCGSNFNREKCQCKKAQSKGIQIKMGKPQSHKSQGHL